MKKEIIVFEAHEEKRAPLPYDRFQTDFDFRRNLIKFVNSCDYYGIKDIRVNEEKKIFEFEYLKERQKGETYPQFEWVSEKEQRPSLILLINLFYKTYDFKTFPNIIIFDIECVLPLIIFNKIFDKLRKKVCFLLTYFQYTQLEK